MGEWIWAEERESWPVTAYRRHTGANYYFDTTNNTASNSQGSFEFYFF